ncbi:MAG: acyloxyacyl hydrolase, partial [Gammaproteobacteria bacterium]
PYIEGGIGLIYSDFQVAGQGLRFNFNPQLGIGLDRLTGETGWFADLRLHHISNGNLHHDNRGINSLALVTGIYF